VRELFDIAAGYLAEHHAVRQVVKQARGGCFAAGLRASLTLRGDGRRKSRR
jgi:hypothetical protein